MSTLLQIVTGWTITGGTFYAKDGNYSSCNEEYGSTLGTLRKIFDIFINHIFRIVKMYQFPLYLSITGWTCYARPQQ